MVYSGTVVEGVFKERPNRFIATVWIENQLVTAHVRNTGRCKELLVEGVTVLLEHAPSASRKTAYSLTGVFKGDLLFNIDSQAPNAVVKEALLVGSIPEIGSCLTVKSEFTHGHSRFDFLAVNENAKWLIEVKGVTLEEKGIMRFPDAPTERGRKHINGLVDAVKNGFQSMVIFVIQMECAYAFEPNRATDPQFAKVLEEAHQQGVLILAYNCKVSNNGLTLNKRVPVYL